MTKKVLDVGNCAPDYAAICNLLTTNFRCEVSQADRDADALAALRNGAFDLVLINRKLDCDYSDGIEVLRQIKADAALAAVPVMLVTNMPEHQDAAVEAGAERGFGKLEFDKPETLSKLGAILGEVC